MTASVPSMLGTARRFHPERTAAAGAGGSLARGRAGGPTPRRERRPRRGASVTAWRARSGGDVHTRNAKKAGATREEVAEAAFIAASLRSGAAVTHGLLTLKLFDGA